MAVSHAERLWATAAAKGKAKTGRRGWRPSPYPGPPFVIAVDKGVREEIACRRAIRWTRLLGYYPRAVDVGMGVPTVEEAEAVPPMVRHFIESTWFILVDTLPTQTWWGRTVNAQWMLPFPQLMLILLTYVGLAFASAFGWLHDEAFDLAATFYYVWITHRDVSMTIVLRVSGPPKGPGHWRWWWRGMFVPLWVLFFVATVFVWD